MNLELKIADLKINIDSFYDKYLVETMSKYISKCENFDFFIKTDITQNTITPPDAKKLTDRTVSNWYVHSDGRYEWFCGKRINNPNTHGTGCTLSSAIASNMAKGFTLEKSVERAKDYISGALSDRMNLGQGSGPLNHAFDIKGEFSKGVN